MPKLVGKVVLHSFRYQFVFKLHFQYGHPRPFWIRLLTNSAAIFARVMGAKFFLNTSKSSNQVSNLTMLSVVTGPPDCTQLYEPIIQIKLLNTCKCQISIINNFVWDLYWKWIQQSVTNVKLRFFMRWIIYGAKLWLIISNRCDRSLKT